MDEKTLLILAVIVFSLGLSGLYLIAENLEPSNLSSHPLSKMDEDVSIEGYIKSISYKEGVTFITIEHTYEMPIIMFDELKDYHKYDKINILGQISKYDDKIEIIAKKIRKIT